MAVDQFCGIPIPTDDPDLATKLRRVACITATYSAPLPRLSLLPPLAPIPLSTDPRSAAAPGPRLFLLPPAPLLSTVRVLS